MYFCIYLLDYYETNFRKSASLNNDKYIETSVSVEIDICIGLSQEQPLFVRVELLDCK